MMQRECFSSGTRWQMALNTQYKNRSAPHRDTNSSRMRVLLSQDLTSLLAVLSNVSVSASASIAVLDVGACCSIQTRVGLTVDPIAKGHSHLSSRVLLRLEEAVKISRCCTSRDVQVSRFIWICNSSPGVRCGWSPWSSLSIKVDSVVVCGGELKCKRHKSLTETKNW